VSIKVYVKSSAEIRETARIGDTGGRYLLDIVKRRVDREREAIETNPRFDRENPANDLVYRLGMIAGLKWVLGVPGECSEFLKKVEHKEEG
jgi:hypothetical protein